MRQVALRTTSGMLMCLVTLAVPSPLQAQSDPAKFFKANCTLCHGEDGSGSSPTGKALKAKDLRSSEVQDKSDAELAEVIMKGKGKMPAFGAKIKPDDGMKLVAYIRSLAKKP
jgi:mono/diheme cytochrome c family protein